MKRCSVVALTAAVCLAYVAVASAQNPQVPCLIGNSLLPPYTQVNLGPTVYDAAVTYPEVANAIVAARDAWNNMTHASNRIGNGTVNRTASDCPVGQPLQVGAFDFMNTDCAPTNGRRLAVAYTDSVAFCPGCGTKSISLNLHYMWSTNPQSGQYDIQGVMTHEFGHLLGLWHMYQGTCGDVIGPRCSTDPDKNTMMVQPYDAETCIRDLNYYDILNANSVY